MGHKAEQPRGEQAPPAALDAASATLVAQTAVDLFLEPALVERAWAAFREE